MPNRNDDLDLKGLGLDDLNLDFDPIKDTRKPIVKISTSFGSALGNELKTYRLVKDVTLAALPDTYKTAYLSVSNVTAATKKIYQDAVKEFKPIVPDIKRTVQKILPTGKKFLPDKVSQKLDAMTKPDEERETTPSPEEQQNREISGSLAEIFKTQMEYSAGEGAKDRAYQQVRDQVQDDQFRINHRTIASINAGIQRLVAYQDQVTASYQRKSLELQYRQYFATRELLRVTAMSAASTTKYLNAIMINTALPDFKKSSEFGKTENDMAKRLAASMFPNAQKFIDQYFSNFTNAVSGRVRENLSAFIDAYRGAQSANEMADGLIDKHKLMGQVAGEASAQWLGQRFGKTLKTRLVKSKALQHLGNKLSYKLANIPQRLNKFANDGTDYTLTHGFLAGNFLNLLRDLTPRISEGSNVISKSTLLTSNEPVPFNLATRQSLTEVIPGYLSRIHHELAIMRTGNANVARLSWNPTKGQFTRAKDTARDISKEVIRSGDIENTTRKTGDFVNTIDPNHKLSKEARDYLSRRVVSDALSGRGFDPEAIMNGGSGVDPKLRKEIQDHFRLRFHVDNSGRAGKTSNYNNLNAARVAHEGAVNSVPGIRERAAALEETGYGEALRGMGITTLDKEGQSTFDVNQMIDVLLNKKKLPTYRDPYEAYEAKLGGGGLSGMLKAAAGGGGAGDNLASLNRLREGIESFNKSSDSIIQELKEGALVTEERRQVEALNKILKILETRSFGSKSGVDQVIKKGKATVGGAKDKTTDAYQRLVNYLSSGAHGHTGPLGHAHSILGGALGLVGGIGRLGYQGARFGTRAAWGMTKVGLKALKLPFEMGKATLRGVGHLGHWAVLKASDVYVKGQKQPALYAKYMEQGRYVNATNGKPIHSIRDIKGPVKDNETGDIVLTAEEYANGLYDSNGVRIFKGISGGIFGLTKWMTKMALINPIKIALNLAKLPFRALGAVKRFVTYDTDIYVGGEKTPRLYATYMRQGRYVCVPTGKTVHKASDIKGEVKDLKTGDILISKEDLDRGIYNALGHNLTRIIRAAWTLAKIPLKVAEFAWHAGKAVAHGAFSLVSGGVKGLASRLAGHDLSGKGPVKIMMSQLDTQRAIFQLLHERLAKPKHIRANSWEEKFLKTKEAEEKAKKGGMQAVKGKIKNPLTALGGYLSKLFHRKKKDDDDDSGDGFLDKIKGVKKLKGFLGKSKLGRGLGRLVRGGKGLLGRAGGLLGRGALAGGGEALAGATGAGEAAAGLGAAATAGEAVAGAGAAAAEIGGTAAVLGGIGEAAAGVGAAALGILSSPVLLIAGAAVALGVGAYLAWKWYKGRGPKDLVHVRLAQYGIDKDNSREVEKVLKLEGALEKHVRFQGTRASIDFKGVNAKDIIGGFGVDMKNPKELNAWMNWFKMRFEPVYLNFMQAVKTVAPNVKLGNADKDLKASQKLKVLDDMKKLDRNIYKVNYNPFAGQHKFLFFGKVGNIQAGTYYVDMAFKEAEANLHKEAAKEKKEQPEKGGAAKAAAKAATGAAGATAAAKAAAGKGKATTSSTVGAKGVAAAAAASTNKIAGGSTKLVSNVIQFKPLNDHLTPLQSLRFRQYGLTEMTHDKMATLYALEQATLAKVKIDAKGQASFTGDASEFFKHYCTSFGSINTDAAAKKNWTDWYLARFVPTAIQFASAVFTVNPHIKPEDAETYLKPSELLSVAKNILGAKAGAQYSHVSVWAISTSPWPNYKLNMDVNSTKFCIENLKSAVANQVYQEKNVPKTSTDKAKATTPDKGKTTPPPSTATASTRSQMKQDMSGKTPSSGSDTTKGGTVSFKTPPLKPGHYYTNSTSGTISGLPIGKGYASTTRMNEVGPAEQHFNVSKSQAITELRKQMTNAGIMDPKAQANILANVDAESDFRPRSESMHYSAARLCQIFPKHFSGIADAQACINQGPEAVGNRIYGGRMGNASDEGFKYRGRGFIQITGKDNYERFGKMIGVDLVDNPDLANRPDIASKLAIAYIQSRMHGKNLDNSYAVTAAVDPANLRQQQSKRAALATQFLAVTTKPVPGGATSKMGGINTMASSGSVMSGGTVSAAHHKFATPAMGAATGGISSLASLTTPGSQTAKSAASRTIASTPTPDISQPASRAGGMYFASDDRIVEDESRRNVMQRTAANDDLMRRSNELENSRSSKVADLLAQSLEVQTSMDTTLKAILSAVTNPNGGFAPSKGTGSALLAGSKGKSQPLSQSPVDLQRNYG